MPLPNLLLEFDQSKVMNHEVDKKTGLPLNMAAAQGACHNFAIHWLSLMYADQGAGGLDKAKARNKTMAQKKGEANPILQKVFLSDTAGDLTQCDRLMVALRGMKFGKDSGIGKTDSVAYNQAAIINLVKAPIECGMIYSFWFKDDNAHTIGIFRKAKPSKGKMAPTDKVVQIFEPNFGEFEIDEANLGKWLDALQKEYQSFGGLGFASHWVKNVLPL